MAFRETEALERILTRQQVADIIDLVYRGRDGNFIVYGVPCTMSGTRGHIGTCSSGRTPELGLVHQIWIAAEKIIRFDKKGKIPGGGSKTPIDIVHGTALVLVHEVQHANQSIDHLPGHALYQGSYRKRPCEVDARRRADEMYHEIAVYLGLR